MGKSCKEILAVQSSAPHSAPRADSKPAQRTLKRLLDVVGSLVLLLLFGPLLLLIALLIRLLDGSPVVYRRRVVGRRGEFDAFKFRTMRPDADIALTSNPELKAIFENRFKLRFDPRVTPLGARLRKYSLDELPQLWNVLRGEMSLVGPRMITSAELGKYGEYRDLLLSIRPGVTGYWQVNGRQNVSYNERVHMDAFYIRNWSLVMDLKILLKTPVVVLRGEGAY